MEVLVSIAITLLTGIYKFLVKKVGKETGRLSVLLFVFGVSLLYSILAHYEILTWEMVQTWLQVGLGAVGVYEVLYKRLLLPVLKNG